MKSSLIVTTALAACLSLSVAADEITDAISEAVSAYKGGKLSEAVSQLDYASALIRQQKAAKLLAVFPEPLKGWTAENAESESAGASMMGGGISANRTYVRGENEVSIELVTDSPMLQSVMGMLNNPALITMNGNKLIKIQGHKAVLDMEEKDYPEIMLIINGKTMFTLKGNNAGVDDLKAYGEKLNLDAL